MDTKAFIKSVVTTDEGYFLLATGDGLGGWWEHFFSYPSQLDEIVAAAEKYAPDYNVYFTAHLFDTMNSSKNSVLPSRTIQADLDEATLKSIPFPPSVVVRTSPDRHQAYWVLEDSTPIETLEMYSRSLTYSIPKCDRSGWSLGHRMRLPNTINYKRAPDLYSIEVVNSSFRTTNTIALEQLPGLDSYKLQLEHYDTEFIANSSTIALDIGPLELLERAKGKGLNKVVYASYKSVSSDRSATLWSLICACFRAGLTREEVFWLAKHSANNKFTDLKYYACEELAKDVLRGEQAVRSNATNPKELIDAFRKMNGTTNEKRQLMAAYVISKLQEEGSLCHANNGTIWYINKGSGHPIQLAHASEYLRTILSIEFGLNNADTDTHYVINEIIAYAYSLSDNSTICALSYCDLPTKTVLVHCGKKDVARITQDGIDYVQSGYANMIFPWQQSIDAFKPDPSSKLDWAAYLLNDSIKQIIDIPQSQAFAILKVWFLFVLLRSASESRPILALLGQPGSGKSTLMKKFYRVLYGKRRSVGGLTNKENFDQAVSSDCFVGIDNVDTYEPWLLDRIALSAGNSDIVKRKLYSDADSYVMTRQAVLGLTAHNPQFGREDIADRLIILNWLRLPDLGPEEQQFKDEATILGNISDKRDQIWGSILKDLHTILQNPMPTTYPQFRIADFARLGAWIGLGVGCLEDFTKGIKSLVGSQKRFVLDEDQILVDSIQRWLDHKNGTASSFLSVGQIWSMLEMYSPDPTGFTKRYRNSQSLSRKLWAFMDALKEVCSVEYTYDASKGVRLWKLAKKVSPDE